MTVIQTYTYYSGGIGDLLRSVFAHFVYCKQNNIDFYFLVQDNHPFKDFFIRDANVPEIKDPITYKDLNGKTTDSTRNILKEFKNNDKLFLITSNVFDFVDFDSLCSYRESFLEFLKISDSVKNRIEELKPKKSFNSIHLRLGDAHMDNVNIKSDIRYKGYLEKDIRQVCDYLSEPDKDIILFTDNNKIKTIDLGKFNLKILNTNVHHSALPGNSSEFLDSLVEFFILGKSNKIVSMSNSGFSFWSSFIFNRPLYSLKNGEVLEFKYSDLKF